MRSSMLYLCAQMTSPHSSILLPTKLSSISIVTLLSVFKCHGSSQRKHQYLLRETAVQGELTILAPLAKLVSPKFS
jgi:hypothetical protein